MRFCKLFSVIFVFCVISQSVNSQILGQIKLDPKDIVLPNLSSGNCEIIQEAIEYGLFITKTNFQICDKETGELFGLNGHKEFGTQYSVGIITTDGIVLTDKAIRPWIYNSKYKKYSEKYDPVFGDSQYRNLEKDAKYDSLALNITSQQILVDSAYYKYEALSFEKKGFKICNGYEETIGWIIWVSADSEEKLFDGKLDFQTTKIKVQQSSKKPILVDCPVDNQKFLTGLYLVPTVSSAGVIKFSLGGLISVDGEKYILNLVSSEKEDNSENPKKKESEVIQEDETLTPIVPVETDKKSKKKKKR